MSAFGWSGSQIADSERALHFPHVKVIYCCSQECLKIQRSTITQIKHSVHRKCYLFLFTYFLFFWTNNIKGTWLLTQLVPWMVFQIVTELQLR